MPTRVWIGPNETPAELVEVVSSTELHATYMGGGDGRERVRVLTSIGETTLEDGFEALRPPVITSVTPDRGVGGTRVIIRGHGFEA